MKKMLAALLIWLAPVFAFAAAAPIPTGLLYQNWLSGLVTANDGTQTATAIDIEAGQAMDSTNTVLFSAPAFIKSISAAWAAGSGNTVGGLGNGVTAAAGWYDICLGLTTAGVADYWFDTSNRTTTYSQCVNHPAGMQAVYRRVASIKLSSATQIIAYVQTGDVFLWKVPVADFPNATMPVASPALETISVPTGFSVLADLSLELNVGGSAYYSMNVYQPGTSPAAPSSTNFTFVIWVNPSISGGGGVQGGKAYVMTTNGQVYLQGFSSAGDTTGKATIETWGYTDWRGKTS